MFMSKCNVNSSGICCLTCAPHHVRPIGTNRGQCHWEEQTNGVLAGLNLSRNTPPTLDPAPFFFLSPPLVTPPHPPRRRWLRSRNPLSRILMDVQLPSPSTIANPPPPPPSTIANRGTGTSNPVMSRWIHTASAFRDLPLYKLSTGSRVSVPETYLRVQGFSPWDIFTRVQGFKSPRHI